LCGQTGKNLQIIIYKTLSKFKATIITFSFPQVTGHHRIASGDIAYVKYMQRIALCIRMLTRVAIVAVDMIRD
jgi:hypothetical protein